MKVSVSLTVDIYIFQRCLHLPNNGRMKSYVLNRIIDTQSDHYLVPQICRFDQPSIKLEMKYSYFIFSILDPYRTVIVKEEDLRSI